MTKLNFNKQKVKDSVSTKIDVAIEKLRSADSIANNTSVPNNFNYYYDTVKCLNNIDSSIDKLNKIKEWIDFSSTTLNRSLVELEEDLASISVLDLEERSNLIE